MASATWVPESEELPVSPDESPPGPDVHLSDVPPQPPLDLVAEQVAPGLRIVRVAGELDMLTGPELDTCLRDQLASLPAHLVVDLADVRFLGSTGLRCLVSAQAAASRVGVRLHLVGAAGRAAVERPLRITGMFELFQHYPTLADAVADLAPDQPEERSGERP